jgi:FlaA1/EpsC-like NDP-sugar epimerase
VRKLLLLDHDENAVFFIHRELRALAAGSEVAPLVADITDAERIQAIFRAHRPRVVLHAAAHKHVELMEDNASEAVRNNVFGTLNVAAAARDFDADAFVLISTDKAVRPSSVMGATKRVGEMIVQSLSRPLGTRFVAVRFGNVLGSAGSVVPIFREQIARGGPVTVTHPDVTRFFMSIPEAAQLVLQAGALGRSGEILVLDMGQPLRVLDMARDLIALAGKVPDVDVLIEFTGLKRGEKLHEDLLLDDEGHDGTAHPKIARSHIRPTDPGHVRRGLEDLRRCVESQSDACTRRALCAMVAEATLWTPRVEAESVELCRERSGCPPSCATSCDARRTEPVALRTAHG